MIVDARPACAARAFLHSQNIAYRLVFITRSNCSVVMSAMPLVLGHLVGRVVDQDVDAAELGDRPVDEVTAVLLVADVAGHARPPCGRPPRSAATVSRASVLLLVGR